MENHVFWNTGAALTLQADKNAGLLAVAMNSLLSCNFFLMERES